MQFSSPASWRDYDGLQGFGQGSISDVDALNKALLVGNSINPPNSVVAGDGFAMRVESLESTLKNTTFKMDNVVLWKTIPKLPAFNTVEEHNEISSYGLNPDAGFFAEGALPNPDDSTYARRFAVVKFLGTTRAVSHVGTMVKPAHGDIIAQETVAGTMHLLRMMEKALFYGDSTLVPSGSGGLQFDGLVTQINQKSPSTNIIDLRGGSLSEDNLTDGAMTIMDAPNYGQGTHFFCSPKVKSDLVKTFFPKERFDMLSKPANGMIGLDIGGFTSPSGDVMFMADAFIDDGGTTNSAAVGPAATIPSSPTVSVAPAAGSDAASLFTANDAGSYYYYIVACNQYGRSAPVLANSSALSVTAGQSVTFTLTPGAIAPDYWAIYRTPVNQAKGTQRLIQKIGNSGGTSTQVITDENATLPGTTIALLLQLNLECLSFKQLAPMVKIPLSIIDTSIRWMQLIYGTPVLYTPGKVVLYKNIGRAANYVGAP